MRTVSEYLKPIAQKRDAAIAERDRAREEIETLRRTRDEAAAHLQKAQLNAELGEAKKADVEKAARAHTEAVAACEAAEREICLEVKERAVEVMEARLREAKENVPQALYAEYKEEHDKIVRKMIEQAQALLAANDELAEFERVAIGRRIMLDRHAWRSPCTDAGGSSVRDWLEGMRRRGYPGAALHPAR